MAKICMNEACKATATSPDWKRGWGLKSGGFATLCHSCGSAYENLLYCDSFHLQESGWRECKLCGKRIHCGCIVSKDLHDYLDSGGVGCIGCSKKVESLPLRPAKEVPNGDISNGISPPLSNNVIDLQSSSVDNRTDDFNKGKLIQLNKVLSENEALIQLRKSMVENNEANGHKQEGTSTGFAAHSALSFSSTTPLAFRTPILEKIEPSKVPPFQQGQRSAQTFPKHSKSGINVNKGTASETRVPRPPAEGRGRGQLLPRYWPKITDQELQQISGEYPSLNL